MASFGVNPISFNQGISNLGGNQGFGSPASGLDSGNATGLLDQGVQNDALMDAVNSQIQNMNTAFTIRQQIASALHAMSNQAQSFSQQFIGDEIAQAKKSNENAGKAV